MAATLPWHRSGIAADRDMGSIEVRPATPQDLPAVESLLRAADLPVEGVGAGIDRFAVAVEDGEIAGAVGLEAYPPHALLRSLVVAEAVRGLGLGRHLVAEGTARAAREGADGVYLLTTTAADFFAGLGFRIVARDDVAEAIQRSEEFSTLCPASAVVMHKQFDHG